MGKALKYAGLLFFMPFWWIQKLVPRKTNIWVFGAWYGDRFSDNSRYLFQYIKEYHPEINAIWLTRNKEIRDKVIKFGGKSALIRSFEGFYYSLFAKAVFVSSGKKDVNSLWINGATLIHLWHGNPLKKIGLDDKYSLVNSFFYSVLVRHMFPMVYEFNYHYMVSNAPIFSKKMASAYDLPLNRILETGCPRNDVFFRKTTDSFNDKLRVKFNGAKLVYYLPTFRNLEEAKTLFTLEDYDREEIESFLESENIVFVSKGHYIDHNLNSDVEAKDSRIVHLTDEDVSDINYMLKDADLLVTDYSSAYFDFLLTERPIIFAAFDLEEYMSASRELYFEYSEAVAGPIVKNWAELCSKLAIIWGDKDFKKLVMDKNKIFNKYHDDKNAYRVYETVIKLLG